jgi:hypothetical protein
VAEMRIWTEGRRFENHDKLRNLSPKLLHSPREIPNRAEKARRRPENRAVSKESPSCREGSRNSYPLHISRLRLIEPDRSRVTPRFLLLLINHFLRILFLGAAKTSLTMGWPSPRVDELEKCIENRERIDSGN